MSDLAASRLREVLRYEQDTGKFFWLVRTGGTAVPGAEAKGTPHGRGYIRIGVAGGIFPAHRLAFLWMTGEWPTGEIDHINGSKSDNRWKNLREVDRQTNQENMRAPFKSNASGFLGVSQRKSGKWWARITINRKTIDLGGFESGDLAHAAYVEAKRTYHKGCTL